jgi:phage terminase large subunit-like protein
MISAPSPQLNAQTDYENELLPETLLLPAFKPGLLSSCSKEKLSQFLESYDAEQRLYIKETWYHWARRKQLPPEEPWRTWLLLGGRGSGKTRAAAEWVRKMMDAQDCSRMALIGPTFADVRDVMIEGESGLLATASRDNRPTFEISRRRITWPNGGMALVFSAEDPDSMRGPQFDGAWGDEIAAWSKPDAVMDTLRPALRLGDDPRLVLSTTPRPVPILKSLMADPTCKVVHASTRENMQHLSPGFVEELEARWAGTIWARQELDGEMIEDPRGALWSRVDVLDARGRAFDFELDRIVVAIDPPVSVGPKADTCGIIVAGAGGEGHNRKAVILADVSIQGATPAEWSQVAARAYEQFRANLIVAEANQGGEMVRSTLALAAPQAPIRLVHASTGKRARAEPIALLYAQGRVAHNAHFRDLEDEMCRFGALGFRGSPDRVDALVWALTDLILDRTLPPSARSL